MLEYPAKLLLPVSDLKEWNMKMHYIPLKYKEMYEQIARNPMDFNIIFV